MKSEEGKETLAQIQAEENITLEGFPDPEEYQLKALNPDDDNREEAVTVSAVVEENGNIEVKGGEEQEGSLIKISEFSREEDSEINRKEGSANEEEGAVEVESSVVEGPLGEIIHSLKSELQDLEEIGLLGKVHTEEEKTIIKDCTLKINEELIKVNGFVENEKEISLESIQELESKVKSQIQIIKDHSSEDGFGLIQPYIEEIDSCFSKISGESQSEKISSRKAKSYVKKIKSLLNNIESGSDFDHQAVVSRSFNRMMKKIEDQLGSKIKLSTDVGLYGELPEYLKHELNLDDVMSSSSQDIKYFQHKILKQSLIIQDLTKKYNSSRNTLKELKDKWFVFHIQAKKNLDPSDRLAAKTIETEFENFDNQFGSTEENSKTLASITNDLVQEMGGKELKIDPQLLAEIGALSEENQEKLKEFIKNNESVSSPQGKEDIEEDIEGDRDTDQSITLESMIQETGLDGDIIGLENDRSHESNQELDRLRSEIEVLKTQVENSLKLIESGNEKIQQLEELLESRNDLMAKMEEENKENRKVIDRLEDNVERFQTAETRYHDTMIDASKNMNVAQEELDAKLELIAQQKTEIDILNNKIDSLNKGTISDSLLKAKEEQVESLTKSLQHKTESVIELKKQFIQQTAKMNSSEQKFKQISAKMHRMAGEYESLKKQNRTAAAKAESSTQALKQTQKTVNKLTVMTDNLRKERQKYIRATNENLAKYKSMATEASLMAKKIHASTENLESLNQQLEKSKSGETQLRKEINEWKAKYVDAQKELKKADRQIRELELKKSS